MNEKEILIQQWIETRDFDTLEIAEQLLVTEVIGADTYKAMRSMHLEMMGMTPHFGNFEDRKVAIFSGAASPAFIQAKSGLPWFKIAAIFLPMLVLAWYLGTLQSGKKEMVIKLKHDTLYLKPEPPVSALAVTPAQNKAGKPTVTPVPVRSHVSAVARNAVSGPIPKSTGPRQKEMPGIHVTSLQDYRQVGKSISGESAYRDAWVDGFSFVSPH